MGVDITAKIVVGFKITADEYTEAKRRCTDPNEWEEIEEMYIIRTDYYAEESDCGYIFSSKELARCDAEEEIKTLDITKFNDYDEEALKKAFKMYFTFSEAKLGIHLCVVIW